MDYKSVIEEQIRELQKIQDENIKAKNSQEACRVAETILRLTYEARNM